MFYLWPSGFGVFHCPLCLGGLPQIFVVAEELHQYWLCHPARSFHCPRVFWLSPPTPRYSELPICCKQSLFPLDGGGGEEKSWSSREEILPAFSLRLLKVAKQELSSVLAKCSNFLQPSLDTTAAFSSCEKMRVAETLKRGEGVFFFPFGRGYFFLLVVFIALTNPEDVLSPDAVFKISAGWRGLLHFLPLKIGENQG